MCTHDLVSRRDTLRAGFGCAAYVALGLGAMAPTARRAFARQEMGETVFTRPFARIEKLAEGVWAVVATPQGGYEVVSNGGIIAGRDAVVVIEGTMSMAGAAFVRDAAKALTLRAPTHVVLTHFHFDHADGLPGYVDADRGPAIISTGSTRRLLCDRYKETKPAPGGDGDLVATGRAVLPDTLLLEDTPTTELDLGGRTLRLVQRRGHTPSDMTIEVDEPRITWTGDLFFNGLFPYYGDAIPTALAETCAALPRDTTFVPGHGPVATVKEFDVYRELIDDVGAAARRAHEKGVPPDEAWKTYEIPPRLGTWTLFQPDIVRHAFVAWDRELSG